MCNLLSLWWGLLLSVPPWQSTDDLGWREFHSDARRRCGATYSTRFSTWTKLGDFLFYQGLNKNAVVVNVPSNFSDYVIINSIKFSKAVSFEKINKWLPTCVNNLNPSHLKYSIGTQPYSSPCIISISLFILSPNCSNRIFRLLAHIWLGPFFVIFNDPYLIQWSHKFPQTKYRKAPLVHRALLDMVLPTESLKTIHIDQTLKTV